MTTIEQFMRIPIHIDSGNERIEALTQPPEDTELVATDSMSVEGEKFFAPLLRLAQLMHEGTRWNKKARIVLEYDPGVNRIHITSFMAKGEE